LTAPDRTPFEQAFEIYGVGISVGASEREVFERLVALLPAGVPECDPELVQGRFMLLSSGENAWHFVGPNVRSGTFVDVAIPLGMLDTALRAFVVDRATDKVFVHAGAVAHRGRAIVIPGGSFSGKSMLVAALVRAGADYYSDEHAVLDEHGLVHPYARPVSIRADDTDLPSRQSAESLGGRSGADPIPVGLIAATSYSPEARFTPKRLSAGQGVLVLLEHTAHTQTRTADAMAAVRHAVSDALVVAGPRGDADAAAQVLLELASGAAANGTAAG